EESFFTNWTGKIAREYISPLFKDFEKYRSYAVDRQIEIGFNGVDHLKIFMDSCNWANHLRDLELIYSDVQPLLDHVKETKKIECMLTCLDNNIKDLQELLDFERSK
ncbi:MAG: hypothetical protein FWF15_11235, partial [Oscillospiraceae bacterium]|nr:hypothetical protein [Oscillospiraceae bacterium]